MPYTGSLYSADDSDIESFSDELSPTDGYFTRRDHPQEVMIQDPSLEANQSTSQWKADGARGESEANPDSYGVASSQLPRSSPSPIFTSLTTSTAFTPVFPTANIVRSSTIPRSQRENLYSETSALFYHTAPPAYSPATSQARTQPLVQNVDVLNYSTFPVHQLEHQPESMSQPGAFNGQSPLGLKQFRNVSRLQQCKKLLLIVLVLSLAVGILIIAVKPSENVSSYFLHCISELALDQKLYCVRPNHGKERYFVKTQEELHFLRIIFHSYIP
jgi:hypothetical protein